MMTAKTALTFIFCIFKISATRDECDRTNSKTLKFDNKNNSVEKKMSYRKLCTYMRIIFLFVRVFLCERNNIIISLSEGRER